LKLSEIAEKLNLEFFGDPDKEIACLSAPTNPLKNSICLVSNHKNINKSLVNAGAILCNHDLSGSIVNENFLISDTPKLTFALLSNLFATPYFFMNLKNNERTFTGKDLVLGSNIYTGIGVVIEDSVSIGDNVQLSHNVIIHKGVTIGNNVSIGAGSIIGSEGFGNVLNEDGSWEHIHHLGSVIIHDNVSIGSNCTIDRGTINNTVINRGVIIDNQVHIAHNVHVGENTAIAANVGIAGSCNIGKRNMIGGMVGIVDHIKTANDVIISATSSVTKDLMEPGVYSGIMPISKHSTWKRIAFWITKLDKIVKKLNIKKI